MLEDPGTKNQRGLKCEIPVKEARIETMTLNLCDGFDEVLVDGYEIGAVFIVDDNIGETDEQPLLLVDCVRDPVPHGRNQKVAHVHAVDRTDANANLLAFRHRFLLPDPVLRLAFTTQKLFDAGATFLFVLAHFLAALLEHAGHTSVSLTSPSLEVFRRNCKTTARLMQPRIHAKRRMLDQADAPFLYCVHHASLEAFQCCVGVTRLSLATGTGCGGKTIQYPEDHERYLRIDKAVESLRKAYAEKNASGLASLMVPMEATDRLQQEAESDFETFHDIVMDFRVERIMIDNDDVDVYVHWSGLWKKDPEDPGMRHRGHSRLQWVERHQSYWSACRAMCRSAQRVVRR